jgi:AraC-like DNA-binding protein
MVVAPARAPGVVSMTGYRTLDGADGVHLGMPSARLTFIVSLDDGVEAAPEPELLAATGPRRVVLGGLHQRATHVRQRRGQAGIQLAVHPLAARALFGVPAADLDVRDFDGLAVLGRAGTELCDRVAEAHGWAASFEVVRDHLRRAGADRHGAVRPEVRHAWLLLERSRGRLPVAVAAAQVGLTPRHLATLFRREVGLAPKAVARLMRFESATAAIARSVAGAGRVDLAAVAAATGFADQAHLSREFVGVTGRPPRRWIAAEFRNIQDGGHGAAPSCRHDLDSSHGVADPASP